MIAFSFMQGKIGTRRGGGKSFKKIYRGRGGGKAHWEACTASLRGGGKSGQKKGMEYSYQPGPGADFVGGNIISEISKKIREGRYIDSLLGNRLGSRQLN